MLLIRIGVATNGLNVYRVRHEVYNFDQACHELVDSLGVTRRP